MGPQRTKRLLEKFANLKELEDYRMDPFPTQLDPSLQLDA
jgi:hypothetical protein